MDKNFIRKEIATLIDSIKEHSDNIGNKKNISQLELEVILHKIEKLHEKSIIFNYLNKFPDAGEGTSKEKIEDIKSEESIEINKEIKPVEIIKEEVKPVVAESTILIENSTSKESSEKQVVLDLFASDVSTSKKVEKNKENKNTNEHLKKQIIDLKAAIGINEKFQFINELFDGNMQEYNIAINQLDSLANYEEASTYLNSLKGIYRWETETPALAHFIDLVERRYPESM